MSDFSSDTRSIIGAQSLINAGLPNKVVALRNGTRGWSLAGFTCDSGKKRRAPGVSRAKLAWAKSAARRVAQACGVEIIDRAKLESWRADENRTLYLFDVRDPASPCYACLFPEDSQFEDVACSTMGVFAPLVGVVGAMQASEALKLLSGAGRPIAGRLLMLDGRALPECQVRALPMATGDRLRERAELAANQLVGRVWTVHEINAAPVADGSRPTLSFDAAGRVSGSSGCNSYNAQYRLSDGIKLYGGWSQAYRPVVFKDIIPTSVYERIDKSLKDAYNAINPG